MGKCAAILASLLERPDATWFKSPVPADTPGYQAAILYPMDYSKIERNLQGGRYQTAAGFASDMRLVFKNAVTFSPQRGNECNMAARNSLAVFEGLLVENGLATDGGAAAAAATEDAASGKAKRKSKTEALVGTPLERCAGILEALMKRRDAQDWFCEPVPEGTDGYADVVKSPMDYGTIQSKIKSGAYAAPAAFAADVRLVAANAVAYSPELDNDCNRAARANRLAFEKAFVKQGLATDGGAALAEAEAASKGPSVTRKRGRQSE